MPPVLVPTDRSRAREGEQDGPIESISLELLLS